MELEFNLLSLLITDYDMERKKKKTSKRENLPIASAMALLLPQVTLGPLGEAVGGAGGWVGAWWYFCSVLFAA